MGSGGRLKPFCRGGGSASAVRVLSAHVCPRLLTSTRLRFTPRASQVVETKADKALTERWLEASQQLHGELQTVHVRTQTLGQGMKVVLGWVEGMADKVTGLQGAQHRMAQQVQSQREEQQFALNATARETISKVRAVLRRDRTRGPLQQSFAAQQPLACAATVCLAPNCCSSALHHMVLLLSC